MAWLKIIHFFCAAMIAQKAALDADRGLNELVRNQIPYKVKGHTV